MVGGCSFLGDLLYRSGDGVKQDLKKAAQFYSKACELKESLGCKGLGELYYYGEGVKKDFKKSSCSA